MAAVVLSSIFRDAAHYIPRYFEQIENLRSYMPVQLIVAEGDSTDHTYDLLCEYLGADDILIKAEHGGPKYESVDLPDRWKRIAWVCNQVMDEIPPSNQPVIYVESDLIWTPEIMLRLLGHLDEVPAVSPLSLRDGFFYDIWGYRGADGSKFSRRKPFHPDLIDAEGLVPIGSAGSCIVMRPEVAQVARFSDRDCIVGLCREIRRDFSLYCDPHVSVTHPA